MQMSTDPRHIASEVLLRVEKYDAYANISFDAIIMRDDTPVKNRNFAKELVFGVLRNKSRLEKAVSQFMKRPFAKSHPFVRNQLLIGAYQILFLDNIPKEIAVDRAVELVKYEVGKAPCGFVNAVLRNLIRKGEKLPQKENLVEYTGQFYSFPNWIASILYKAVGEEAPLLAKALNERSQVNLRTNILKNTRVELSEKLQKEIPNIKVQESKLSPYGLRVKGLSDPVRQPLHRQGFYLIQDEASQLVSIYVDPQPGEKIMDCCAGTGGKSLHLAALCDNKAEILAVDRSQSKMDALLQRSKRAGVNCIDVREDDVLASQFKPDSFDRILLDAPCSGLGVLRRHPEAKWRLQPEDIKNLADIQSSMLHKMSPVVKPGGVLYYIVCTFNPGETTEIIKNFLKLHPEFQLEPLPSNKLVKWTEIIDKDGFFSILPHKHDSDGFFGARMRKKS
jgi:16S rRNA (cytosine967-C5)-methyltransferase